MRFGIDMEEETLVSVIIPVYNSEKTIAATLSSVAQQSYLNIEILIINDGSTDASEEKIKYFIEKHPELDISYSYQPNQGVSAARNAGLKKAKGAYIAFLDSDDQWEKEKTSIQLKILKENPSIDFLACNRNGEKYKRFFNLTFDRLTKITAKTFLLKNFLITPTVIFKKKILKDVGFFNKEMKYAEDYDFFLRCTHTANCFLLNESLVNTGSGKPSFGHSGLSANLWEMEKGELKVLKKAYDINLLNGPKYLLIVGFSFLKFIRRWAITKIR